MSTWYKWGSPTNTMEDFIGQKRKLEAEQLERDRKWNEYNQERDQEHSNKKRKYETDTEENKRKQLEMITKSKADEDSRFLTKVATRQAKQYFNDNSEQLLHINPPPMHSFANVSSSELNYIEKNLFELYIKKPDIKKYLELRDKLVNSKYAKDIKDAIENKDSGIIPIEKGLMSDDDLKLLINVIYNVDPFFRHYGYAYNPKINSNRWIEIKFHSDFEKAQPTPAFNL